MQIDSQLINQTLFLTINDQIHRNALGLKIGQLLLEKLTELKKSTEGLKAVVLSANPVKSKSGEDIWVAGGNLKELAGFNKEQARSYAELYTKIGVSITELPIPVVCLINGAAIGGGAELALWCDLRVMTEDASLSFKQTKLGLATGYGGCSRLSSLIGLANATDILLRARSLTSKQALDLGLCSLVLKKSKDYNSAEITDFLQAFTESSALGLSAQKKMLSLGVEREILKKENSIFEDTWLNVDHKKFLNKFLSK